MIPRQRMCDFQQIGVVGRGMRKLAWIILPNVWTDSGISPARDQSGARRSRRALAHLNKRVSGMSMPAAFAIAAYANSIGPASRASALAENLTIQCSNPSGKSSSPEMIWLPLTPTSTFGRAPPGDPPAASVPATLRPHRRCKLARHSFRSRAGQSVDHRAQPRLVGDTSAHRSCAVRSMTDAPAAKRSQDQSAPAKESIHQQQSPAIGERIIDQPRERSE